MKTALTLCGVLLVSAAAAHGERREPVSITELEARFAERFAAADADGDDRISSDEFSAADLRPLRLMRRGHHRRPWGGGTGPKFDAIDADGDGSISRDELAAARSAGHHRGKPGRDGDGGKPDKAFSLPQSGTPLTSKEQPASRGAVSICSKEAAMKDKVFARLDADRDGFLSQAEFGKPVERLRALDADGDGQVDRDERRSGFRKRGRG